MALDYLNQYLEKTLKGVANNPRLQMKKVWFEEVKQFSKTVHVAETEIQIDSATPNTLTFPPGCAGK